MWETLKHIYAKNLINNKNLLQEEVFLEDEINVKNQDALIYLLSEADISHNNNRLFNMLIDIYPNLSLENRLALISFLKVSPSVTTIDYWLENFDKLTLVEKRYFFTTLQYYNWGKIKPYVLKQIYLGDHSELYLVEDMMNFNFKEKFDADIRTAFGYYYYKINNFEKALNYVSEIDNERAKLIKENIAYCQNSDLFCEKQESSLKEIPINVARLEKAIIDSLITTSFILDCEVIKDKNIEKYEELKTNYEEQLTAIQKKYSNFATAMNEDEQAINRNLFMKVINQTFRYELNCGNVTFHPKDENRFLEIKIKISNLTDEEKMFYADDFYLDDKKNKSKSIWEGRYYFNFSGNKQKEFILIKPNSKVYVSLIFEVDSRASDFVLSYEDSDKLDFVTPNYFSVSRK